MRRFAWPIVLLSVCLAACCWLLCGPQAERPVHGDEGSAQVSERPVHGDEGSVQVSERPVQGDEGSVQSEVASQDMVPSVANGQVSTDDAQEEPPAERPEGLLASPADIALAPADDTGHNYTFAYDAREFLAYYEPDVWKVYDSYLVTNHHDIVMICQALLDEHPICGSDYETVRTAEDMAFEWEQHNIACELLPPDSPWQESVRNVDLDPQDQNKTMREIYDSRMGRASA